MNNYIIIDCPNLLHRALHTTGTLAHKGIEVGTLFGFLRTLLSLQCVFRTDNVVFCFDQGISLREKEYPAYKAARKEKYNNLTPEERTIKTSFQRQTDALRDEYLPALGYKNIFSKEGYEADDLIAEVVLKNYNTMCIMASTDKDLFQLLDNSRVVQHLMRGAITYTSFNLSDDYFGITPKEWAYVKAIAGCSTDGIAGVKGVGEMSAAKYVTGQLGSETKRYRAIVKEKPVWRKNLPLVTLPYAGCTTPGLQEDYFNKHLWKKVTNHLGMYSLQKHERMK